MFYLLNKRKGISSFKAIKEFAKENNIKKVGHTGTLDPLATGLLLIATDEDTKLINYIDKESKSYIVTMKLGYKSDTLDSDGNVKKVEMYWDGSKVKNVIMSFAKTYQQIPPAFSAKKINGKRAYELARGGKEVKLKPSEVTIEEVKNIKKISDDTYEFEVKVSRGTYIRSLIRDIAHSLKTEGIMTDLIRSELIGLKLEDAGREMPAARVVKLDLVEIKDMRRLLSGLAMTINEKDGTYGIKYNNNVIGIIDVKDNIIINRRILGKKYERLLNESHKVSK